MDIGRTATGVGVEAIFWTRAVSIDDILKGADELAFEMSLVVGQEVRDPLPSGVDALTRSRFATYLVVRRRG